jgi:hypothetical protein
VAIELSDHVDGAAYQAKDTARRIAFLYEDLTFGENRVLHPKPFNRRQKSPVLRRRSAAAPDRLRERSRLNASLGSLTAPAGAWPVETANQCPARNARFGA